MTIVLNFASLNVVAIIIATLLIIASFKRKKIIIWEAKRDMLKKRKQQQQVQTEGQMKVLKGLKELANFLDWIQSESPNSKQFKQFIRDFASKQYRQGWFEKMYKHFAPKPTIKVKPKKEEDKVNKVDKKEEGSKPQPIVINREEKVETIKYPPEVKTKDPKITDKGINKERVEQELPIKPELKPERIEEGSSKPEEVKKDETKNTEKIQ